MIKCTSFNCFKKLSNILFSFSGILEVINKINSIKVKILDFKYEFK